MTRKTEDAPPRSLLARLGWFVALWLAGLACVSAIAFLIRSVLL